MNGIVNGGKPLNKKLNMSIKSFGKRNKPDGGNWDTLAVIADCSGSMAGQMVGGKSKMTAEIDALKHMFKNGLADSRVHLVQCPGYDGNPLAYAPTNKPAKLMDIVNSMYADYMTPMYGALELAYIKTSESNVRFILMSDGMPNDCDNEDIFDLVKDKGVVIDTVGIGDPMSNNYDPEFLKKVAELTGGMYTEVHNYQQFVKDLYKLSPAERKQLGAAKKGGAIAL